MLLITPAENIPQTLLRSLHAYGWPYATLGEESIQISLCQQPHRDCWFTRIDVSFLLIREDRTPPNRQLLMTRTNVLSPSLLPTTSLLTTLLLSPYYLLLPSLLLKILSDIPQEEQKRVESRGILLFIHTCRQGRKEKSDEKEEAISPLA